MTKANATAELKNLRALKKLLRKIMLEGKILLMADAKDNDELIRLAGLKGIVS